MQSLDRINSRLGEAEDQISVLEDKVEKNTQVEQQKRRKNLKKWGEFKKHFGQNEAEQNLHDVNTRRRIEQAKDQEPIWRNNDQKNP